MPSILPDFEYDIFISYRQNDNKPATPGERDGWVTNFVKALSDELEATLKNPVSIYFDENPHDGLLETHQVNASLAKKLKCLVFIPIISQTYCDENGYAWSKEFLPFLNMAGTDELGLNITLRNGNVMSRILPIRIHELDNDDQSLLENKLGGPLRSIDFIYQEPGVNRPLSPEDNNSKNLNETNYKNQVNKVANALKEIGVAILDTDGKRTAKEEQPSKSKPSSSIAKNRTSFTLKMIFGSLFLPFVFFFAYWLFFDYFGDRSKKNNALDKSVAVLYFDNMSGDPNQEYFSDGVTEEIIARLSKIKGLRVISRTSTRVYKGKSTNLKEIADELGVSTILEGSFRKAGDQIRVTATLINANTDEHIWAESFNADLKDVFKVQTDIAHAIAKKFEVKITPETELEVGEIMTNNLEAYEYFLQAKYIAVNQYYLIQDSLAYVRAKKLYEKAIELEPDFAEAYAGLGDLYDEKRNSDIANFPEDLDSLRHALSLKAIQLAPNSAWVNNTRAWTFLNRENSELDSGFYYLKRAWELDHNDIYNLQSLAGFYGSYAGLYDNAIVLYKKALEMDPINVNTLRSIGNTYFFIGNTQEGYKYIQNEIRLRGVSDVSYELRWAIYTEDTEKADSLLQILAARGVPRPWSNAMVLAQKGEFDKSRSLMNEQDLNDNIFLLLSNGMLREAIIEARIRINNRPGVDYLIVRDFPLWKQYSDDKEYQELLSQTKEIYDDRKAKYGEYVEVVLNQNY